MANADPCFYYAPTWDWPPEGPIKLANVLTSIKKPEQPLYTAPLPTTDEIFSSEKTQIEYSKEKLRGGRFSILTKFLSIIGVGLDAGVNWKTSDDEIYKFDKVETVQFVPKDDYVQKCIEAPTVRRHLERSRYHKPVYIITGIKTVYGASAKSHKSQGHGGNVEVAVDGTVWSGGIVPVSVEPGVEVTAATKRATAWEGSSDFVFAFRVCKVKVNKKTQTVKESDDYTEGAMLGQDMIGNLQKDLPKLCISSKEYPKAEDEGCDEDELTEGDNIVKCAILRTEDPGNEE